jgi:hypothetical protein
MERPLFSPMKDGLEYCVSIKWRTGAQSRVNHFACVQDAQRWIDRESENWLRSRFEAPAGRRFASSCNPRGPGIQTLQRA